jgi:hypothetical protein
MERKKEFGLRDEEEVRAKHKHDCSNYTGVLCLKLGEKVSVS